MRRLHTLWAAAGAAGLLTGAITPATAGSGLQVTAADAPPGQSSAESAATKTQAVTLFTGDVVSLSVGPDGKYAVDVQRGKGREAATYASDSPRPTPTTARP
ncbi:hypothetical protein ACWD3J_45225 [Streptomyces sp. NPDC002755]|uniref:hypothetical protein n=1 Tax=Streptomyces sp. NPDC002884 TaxID=3154544 RepID=UPI003329685B